MSLETLGQETLTKIEDYINQLAAEFNASKTTSPKWWEFWKNIPPGRFHEVVQFLLNSLDSLIQFVEPLIPAGADKKAIVMAAVGKLYDFAVVEIMPIWLKPFAPVIKSFILNYIISNAIDFIVSKYNEGASSGTETSTPTPVPAPAPTPVPAPAS